MSTESWTLMDHVCGLCCGRILKSTEKLATGQHRYRCSNCGVQANGRNVRVICACGSAYPTGESRELRCRRNESTDWQPGLGSEIILVRR